MPEERLVRVGQIAGAFGLKGQVKVQPFTDFAASRFAAGSEIFLDGKPVLIERSTVHKGRPLLKLKGIEDVNAAEALQWKYLETAERPELDDDEFLVEDLIGLKVQFESGEILGEIDDVLENPAHEILVVGEILIPLVDAFVLDINVEEEKVTVRLIPGMLPGDED